MYSAPTKAFAHLDRLLRWSGDDRPAPVTLEWDLTERCYLGCQSCHFAHTHVRGPWTGQPRVVPDAYAGTGDLADAALIERWLKAIDTQLHGP